MGFLFQKSCFLVPDAKFLKAQNNGKVKKTTTRKLTARRRRQFEGILEETRAWMYALLIPTELIANGDKAIKTALDAQIQELTTSLLGTKIDESKIHAVCGRIARNILAPGTANLDPGQHLYPAAPQFPQMKHLLDDKFIKAGLLELIYDFCPGFKQQHPDARTWHEIRQVAGPWTLHEEPLPDVLERWQEDMTYAELGVPFFVNWRADAERAIHARIQSSDPSRLNDFSMDERDLILARAEGKPTLPDTFAEMDLKLNVMSLFPFFYDPKLPDSIEQVQLRPGQDSLRDLETRILTLLHEITHSQDVLSTRDHQFEFISAATDKIPADRLVSVPWEVDTYVAYGLESCLALARRDERNNTNKAEDNADSWAFYFTLRILMLIYPDLDIIGTVRTKNPFLSTDRLVKHADKLLHHCTLLFPLRNRNAPDYRNTFRYDSDKDRWSREAHRLDGRRIPVDVKDILEMAQALDNRRVKKSVDRKGKKDRQKARP